MKKILTILAAVCAIACSGGKTTIYDFTAESNSGNPCISRTTRAKSCSL